jgi:hypothetical protein
MKKEHDKLISNTTKAFLKDFNLYSVNCDIYTKEKNFLVFEGESEKEILCFLIGLSSFKDIERLQNE